MIKKKAISELVAYSLLVGLSISLSLIVYAWLRFYIIPNTPKVCPNGISIIVEDYFYGGNINMTIKNKGLFRIDGYIIRINNQTDIYGKPEGLPVYLFNRTILSSSLDPGEKMSIQQDYKASFNRITDIEIQPLRVEDGRQILCDNAILKETPRSVDCN